MSDLRHLFSVLVIAPLLMGASPAPTSAPGSSAPSPTVSTVEDLSFNEEPLVAATTRDPFSGFTIDSNADAVVVYETSAATASDEAGIRQLSLPTGYSLQFDHVSNSWTELSAVQQEVPSLLPEIFRSLLVGVEVDPSTNGFTISLTNIPAGAELAISQVFTTIPIRLTTAAPITAHVTGQSKYDEMDGPWHGGDRLALTNTTYNTANYIYASGCTGGFVLDINGTRYMTTAGHCGAGGGNSHVEQYVGGGGHYIGDVVHRSYNDSGAWDTEYFGGSDFSSAVWTSDSAGAQVKGTVAPRSGAPVCVSGAYHGTNCGYAEGGFELCETVSGVYTCHLGEVGVDGPGEGDSGAPFYESTNGGVLAVGTDVGGDGEGHEFYETISDIESHWGGSVVTG